MNVITISEYQNRIEERSIVKKETRKPMIVGILLLISCVIYGKIASMVTIKPTMMEKKEQDVYIMVSLFVMLILIMILGARRTVYYSPRLIKENFTLTQVLQQWRKIDYTFMAITEVIPIIGLILTFMGIPFQKTFHFFVGPGILTILLMPMGIKVRSRLAILRERFPDIK